MRDDLERVFRQFEILETDDPDARTIRGVAYAGASLVGPPGRLHGGLHSAVRLLLPLARLIGTDALDRTNVALDLTMRRAIALEADVPFEGRFVRRADGGFALTTRFDGTERLDGGARSVAQVADAEAIARLHEAVAEDGREPPEATIRARGSIPTRIGRRLVSMDLDRSFFEVPDLDLARYVRPDTALDAVFAAVALDVAAACVLGFAIKGRVFTTRFELTIGGAPRRDLGTYRLLADRRSVEVEGSTVARVDVGGRSVGETRVEVFFVDASLERVHAHGHVTLVPVRPA